MRAVAKAKMTRTSPQKISLVAALIRTKSAEEAQIILANTNKAAAGVIAKVLDAAIANAENNQNLKKADLTIEAVLVGAGPTLKRTRPRSRGQLNRIMKRTSHITIILSDQRDKSDKRLDAKVEAKLSKVGAAVESAEAATKATSDRPATKTDQKEETK